MIQQWHSEGQGRPRVRDLRLPLLQQHQILLLILYLLYQTLQHHPLRLYSKCDTSIVVLHSTWFLNFPENSIKNVSQKTRGCYCCICIYGQGWERTWLEVRTHHRFLYFYLLLSISSSLSFFISCTTKLKISFIIVWFTLHNYDKPAYELVIKRMRSIEQTTNLLCCIVDRQFRVIIIIVFFNGAGQNTV